MITDTEIRLKGLEALTASLGGILKQSDLYL